MGFSDLRRAVSGISDSVLSDRLVELAREGLVDRGVDFGPPVRVDYELTSAGRALVPVLESLALWARSNLPSPDPDGVERRGGAAKHEPSAR